MLRRLAFPALLAAAVALGGAPDARAASCADVLEVRGRPLDGIKIADERLVPETTGPHPAIQPACGEADDTAISTLRLAEVPPEIAVLDRDRTTLYVARDTLPQVGNHPLHAAVHGVRAPERRGPCRVVRAPLRGSVLEVEARRVRIALGGSRGADVGIDAQSRITNRPAYTPVRPGQQLRLRTSRCGPLRVADRIAFDGPVPGGDGRVLTDGLDLGRDDADSPWVIPAVLLGAGTVFVLVVGLGLLIPRRRRRPSG